MNEDSRQSALAGFQDWSGHYRWCAETAAFTHPTRNHAGEQQTQEIRVDGEHMVMRTRKVSADGAVRSWTWDGLLNGQPRPIVWDDDGSVMANIAFSLLSPTMGGDVFEAGGGLFRGAEVFVRQEDRYRIWGSTADPDGHFTYFEEWIRI